VPELLAGYKVRNIGKMGRSFPNFSIFLGGLLTPTIRVPGVLTLFFVGPFFQRGKFLRGGAPPHQVSLERPNGGKLTWRGKISEAWRKIEPGGKNWG